MQLNQVLLSDDTVILTGSERIARELRGRRAMLKALSGNAVWDDPVFVGPLRRYLQMLWDTLFDDRQLLHAEQVLTLCKQAIDSSPHAQQVISTMSLARSMRQAERILHEHKIPLDRQDFALGLELSSFWDWHKILSARFQRNNYVAEYQLPNLISQAVIDGRIDLPRKIALVGFHRPPPQHQDLFDCLSQGGCEVVFIDADNVGAGVEQKYTAYSLEDEIEQAALWALEVLKMYESANRKPRLAIVVPNLERSRQVITQTFEEILEPHSLQAGIQSGNAEMVRAFGFAGGRSVAELPWVRSALDLAAVRTERNSVDDLSRLLLGFPSPLDYQAREETAQLDLALRSGNGWHVSGEVFLELLQSSKNVSVGRLTRAINSLLAHASEQLTPSEWADHFEQSIFEAGYLDEDWLNRGELHQWWAFQAALDVFRSLDAQLGSITIEPAYRWLDEICHSRWYSEEGESSAPIQILTPHEAMNLTFDCAWVMGMDASTLPEEATPNPFLPLHHQQKSGVPNSSPEINRIIGEEIVAELRKVAPSIVFSYAGQSDGGVLVPSGLIDWCSLGDLVPMTFDQIQDCGKVRLSVPKSDDFPAVDSEERQSLRGGVSLFQDYASDHLAAALKHRLHLKPFPRMEVGLSGSLQGQIIHAVLAGFWGEIRTSQKLKALSHGALEERVVFHSRRIIASHPGCREKRYGRQVLELEKRRVAELVLEWLELEKMRDEDFEVLYCEATTVVEIEGMTFDIRIDRVDRIFCADGSTRIVLIDYKTGSSVDMRDMNTKRLKEPQLPLYTVFSDLAELGITEANGVSLGKVFPREVAMHIRSDWTGKLVEDSKKPASIVSRDTWLHQVEDWRERLTSDAKGFLSGSSLIIYRPHEYLGNHEYLAPLMRLGELENV